MTTQNWPDPTRVGFPMFPDQDGKHVFEIELYPGFVVWEWSAKNKEYGGISYEAEIVYSPEEMAREYKYFGPVLTSTQINEMLAAERERCAVECDKLTDDFLPCHPSEFGREIRNLGAAQKGLDDETRS